MEGELVKKDEFLALAWFREAIRNGNPAPYVEAGNLLYEGDPKVIPRNNLFALVNYLGAY